MKRLNETKNSIQARAVYLDLILGRKTANKKAIKKAYHAKQSEIYYTLRDKRFASLGLKFSDEIAVKEYFSRKMFKNEYMAEFSAMGGF